MSPAQAEFSAAVVDFLDTYDGCLTFKRRDGFRTIRLTFAPRAGERRVMEDVQLLSVPMVIHLENLMGRLFEHLGHIWNSPSRN